MVITIDTSVLFQAFYSSRGASHQIIRLVRSGELTMAISVPVFQEYRDILSRYENQSALNLEEDDVDVIMQFIATIGKPTNISYRWQPNLRGENDNMIVELARASGSAFLVTRNTKDFQIEADLQNDDIRIVTPGEFIRRWRESHEE